MMDHPGCIFCAIAGGTAKAEVICEDEFILAVPDIRPIRPGHVLIITRDHYACFDDAPAPVATALIAAGQHLARALKLAWKVERVAFVLTGGNHPHVHAHVVPMVERTDITSRRYIRERSLTFADLPCASDSDLRRTATELRQLLQRSN